MKLDLIRDENGFQVLLNKDGVNIGNVSIEKDFTSDEYTIIDANIEPEFRGRGLYQKTIIDILKQLPLIKLNSVFRSEEAERAWKSLLLKLPKTIKIKKIPLKLHRTTLYQLYN